jgi:integral membrane protein
MIRTFRYIGILEGITTLALFVVAMPAKYLFGMPQLVPTVGLIHGMAFVVYLLSMMVFLPGTGLTRGQWLRTFLAAFVPLATFFNDPMLKRKQLETELGVSRWR